MPPTFDLRYQSLERANYEPCYWYTLDTYLENGFHSRRDDAQDWMDADIYPEQALLFEDMGMGPQEAWNWGMVPEAVKSFIDAGFTRHDAWEWATCEIFGYEAMFWRSAGYSPLDARVLRTITEPVAQAVLWAVTGMSAADALEHARAGANPGGFLNPPQLEVPWQALWDDWDGRLRWIPDDSPDEHGPGTCCCPDPVE